MEYNLWPGLRFHEIHTYMNLKSSTGQMHSPKLWDTFQFAPQTPLLPPPYIFGAISLYIMPSWWPVVSGQKKIFSNSKTTSKNAWWSLYRQTKAVNSGIPALHCAPFLLFDCALRISLPSWDSGKHRRHWRYIVNDFLHCEHFRYFHLKILSSFFNIWINL